MTTRKTIAVTFVIIGIFGLLFHHPNANAQDSSSLIGLRPINARNMEQLEVLFSFKTSPHPHPDIETGYVNDVAIHGEEGDYLVIAGAYQLYFWHFDDGIFTESSNFTFNEQPQDFDNTLFESSGQFLAFQVNESGIHLWDTIQQGITASLDHSYTNINAMALSKDGSRIAIGLPDGEVCVLNIQNVIENHCMIHQDFSYTGAVNSIVFMNNDETLVTGYDLAGVLFWDIEKSDVSEQFDDVPFVRSVTISPDNQYMAVNNDNDLYLVDLTSFASQQQATRNTDSLFTPDSQLLISASYSKFMRFEIVNPQETVGSIYTDTRTTSLAMSSDGKILVTGDNEGNVTLWGVPSDSSDGDVVDPAN